MPDETLYETLLFIGGPSAGKRQKVAKTGRIHYALLLREDAVTKYSGQEIPVHCSTYKTFTYTRRYLNMPDAECRMDVFAPEYWKIDCIMMELLKNYKP